MITHIVFFKLKDRSPENIAKARDVLANMEGKIPQLRYIEVGVDVLKTPRSFDIALTTRFDSLEDLDAYQVHPVHQEVLKYMKEVVDVSAAVDYES